MHSPLMQYPLEEQKFEQEIGAEQNEDMLLGQLSVPERMNACSGFSKSALFLHVKLYVLFREIFIYDKSVEQLAW